MTMSFIAFRRLRRSSGVGLVTAIFLLVVLAGLGVAMVSISSAQHQASGLDVQGVRAYQAARAGIEWGLYHLSTPTPNCSPRQPFALPPTSSLTGFVVTVKCTPSASGPARYGLESTACNLPKADGTCPNASNNPNYVERKIVVSI